ncbi:F-box domain-containing protein [Mycena kentingensis (nom. inval.)]|nr:F-box domain-containing protein [Mycena kentingensis (nom. inval.)]
MADSPAKTRKLFSAFRRDRHTKLPPQQVSNPLLELPYDVLHEILAYLPKNGLPISLSSRAMHEALLPTLYASLDLRSSVVCRPALSRLLADPASSAVYLRRLAVRPSHPPRWGMADKTDERWVASAIERLATAGHLRELHTFVWDGKESPPDSLWLELRRNCPLLRSIGTSVGQKTQELDPKSNLFAFRNLTGFSLVTQKHKRWNNLAVDQQLPDRLWEMLLIHCASTLEQLTIDGTCVVAQLWDIRKVLAGRWRNLRSISLGDFLAVPDSTEFFEAHPRLDRVAFIAKFPGDSISPLLLPALPQLHTFKGKLNQLKDVSGDDLPHLRNLHLTDYFSPTAKLDALARFPVITSLSVCVNFLDARHVQDFFEHLLKPCPRLVHVDVSATGSFSLDIFASAIPHARNLRTFNITVSRQPHTIFNSRNKLSLAIVAQYPQLEEFCVRNVADWDNHDQLNDIYKLLAVANYTVFREGDGTRWLRVEETALSLGMRQGRSTSTIVKPIP